MSGTHDTTKKIVDLGAIREDPELERVLKNIASISSLAQPPVLFPDLVYKPKNESPASLATATRDTIVPNLTSPSLGCSMGVIATNLKKEDITPEFQRKLYAAMQEHLGERYSILKNILVWLGLTKRPLLKYDLTVKQFEDIIRRGAPAAIERFDLPKDILDDLEFGGSLFSDNEEQDLDLKHLLPRSSFTNGRHDLGYGFKGNHFLEIQVVEKIFDTASAEKFGLTEGSVVIMYHGGGGLIPYHVGRYFANRDKKLLGKSFIASRIKLVLHFFGKIAFHLLSINGLRNIRTRWRYYFRPKKFQEIPLASKEGTRVMNATKASLNYSYAFNMAIIRRVFDALKATGKTNARGRFITTKIHNSIHQEKNMVVHRHTVTHIAPGEMSIVSGFNNTKSYLIVGREGSNNYLNSADHGSGHIIKRKRTTGDSQKHPEKHITRIHKTRNPHEEDVSHITGDGIDYVMNTLEKYDIASKAIQLRPLASFKG